MTDYRNEVSFYPEIKDYIENQLKSNFLLAKERELYVYWGIGELKSNLRRIIDENKEACTCAHDFANIVPPLNLDIFALITDGQNYELLILEIKKRQSVGLKEWSQLIGYCLVSGAKYGLLVNIDNGPSQRLSDILSSEKHLSHIKTEVRGKQRHHLLGYMSWDSITHDFEYSNLGRITSLSALCREVSSSFQV